MSEQVEQRTLYARLGGYDAIAAVAEDINQQEQDHEH